MSGTSKPAAAQADFNDKVIEALKNVQAQQARQQQLLERLAGSPQMAAFVLPTPAEERPSALATAPLQQPPALLTREDLRRYFGITYSREHLSRLVTKGLFPLPVPLGESVYSRKMWRLEDVQNFIVNRPVFDAAFKRAAPPIKGRKSAA